MPKQTMAIALMTRAARQHHRGDQAKHHQREILRRAEFQRQLGKRRSEIGHHQRGNAAGDERADRRDPERRPGAALARHLVAVERGDDRRRFTRDVDQDRSGRAAVLRAVIDAGQHDQRGRRPKPEGERQQHRHRRHRADAGKHADQRAEEAADETIDQVLPSQRDAKTEDEIAEGFHDSRPPARAGSAARAARRTPPPRTQSTRRRGREFPADGFRAKPPRRPAPARQWPRSARDAPARGRTAQWRQG